MRIEYNFLAVFHWWFVPDLACILEDVLPDYARPA